MLASCGFLAGVAALGRYAGLEGFSVLQIVFLRLLFGALSLTPALAVRGVSMLRTTHWRLYAVRIVVGLVGMTTWFAALKLVTVGEVTSIGFLTPLLVTLGAALVLREAVDGPRWGATLVGFLGALIILRPGLQEVSLGTWVALASAVLMATSSLLIKTLAGRDDPDKIVLLSSGVQAAIMAIPAALVWQWPSAFMWLVFVGMGAMGMLGHITLTRAFRATDASVVMPAEFARLPFAVALGYALFGELIDLWTWVGAGVIFAASIYAARRERRLARAMARAPMP
ncbi:DMT family transporter [Acuticoccus sp.]|uniref:DMT family transporter n=1 Tax=Acuticoccus sp. TaxID=1904378 RepID=UPI003B51C709